MPIGNNQGGGGRLPRAQVFVRHINTHRAVATQVWRDKAGNHFTGMYGTVPISAEEAARLVATKENGDA